MKRIIAAFAVAGVLVVGGAGVVAAADSGHRHHHWRHRVVAMAVKTSADTIGIKPRELVKEVCDGKTVAQIAEEHGVSADDVINAIVTKGNAKIDALLAAGKINDAQAAKAKEKLVEKANTFVNETKAPKRCPS